jgi:hypothetical protein
MIQEQESKHQENFQFVSKIPNISIFVSLVS